ncbi:MAG TPA: thioredoxin fold domain-containing protein [Burkholderiales bacterium]|nr:thioredoxin fold domain-containing protein [Burkholderiales bacterium]
MLAQFLVRGCAALITLWASCAPAATAPFNPSPHAIDIPAWFKPSFLDFGEEIADAAKRGKRVLVYFGQDGCPYCRELMRANFGQKDIADKTRRHFDAIAVNIWGDTEVKWLDRKTYTEKSLAALLKVQFTPTLLFLDEKGQVVLRLNGYYPPHQFSVALDYVAGRHEARTSFPQYLAANAREQASGVLHDEPFFVKRPYDLARSPQPRKPLAVLFEQKECAACDQLHREGFKTPSVRTRLGALEVVRLELFGREPVVTRTGEKLTEGEWARRLGVAYVPTIVFFDAAGREVFRVEGYLRPFHLESSFEYVTSGSYRNEPSFQRYVQQRAEKIRRAGGKVQLW